MHRGRSLRDDILCDAEGNYVGLLNFDFARHHAVHSPLRQSVMHCALVRVLIWVEQGWQFIFGDSIHCHGTFRAAEDRLTAHNLNVYSWIRELLVLQIYWRRLTLIVPGARLEHAIYFNWCDGMCKTALGSHVWLLVWVDAGDHVAFPSEVHWASVYTFFRGTDGYRLLLQYSLPYSDWAIGTNRWLHTDGPSSRLF